MRPLVLGSAVLGFVLAASLPALAANAPPDTWFSGPDPALYPLHAGNQRYVDVANWSALPALPDGFLNCDSLTVLPSQRPHRRTFYEIYGNRIFVRAENDTVNQNSWVVFTGGGSDLDSPYSVIVAPGDPQLVDTVACASNGPPWVVRPDGPNGSPIGFRSRVPVKLDPNGILSVPSQTATFPNYDPFSVFRQPDISSYWSENQSGKAYAVLRAQDGDGLLDSNPPQGSLAIGLADSVDLGLDTSPTALARRTKVLTFYVNRNPVLDYGLAAFAPKPPEFNGGNTWVFPANRILSMNLLSHDPDPFPSGNPPGPGGPGAAFPLQFTVTVSGRNAANQPVSYTAPGPILNPSVTINLNAVAPQIVSNDLTIKVSLCDCTSCTTVPGQGRCVEYSIPARIDGPVGTLVSLLAADATPGRASLRWKLAVTGLAHVERTTAGTAWEPLADRWTDANHEVAFVDETVTPGTRYGYRLVLEGASGATSDVAWLDVPQALAFALDGVRPNPGAGDRSLSFALPDDQPATIAVFDASGRRVWNRPAAGAGRHVISLGHDFAPGIYVVRLAHAGRVLDSKFSVVP